MSVQRMKELHNKCCQIPEYCRFCDSCTKMTHGKGEKNRMKLRWSEAYHVSVSAASQLDMSFRKIGYSDGNVLAISCLRDREAGWKSNAMKCFIKPTSRVFVAFGDLLFIHRFFFQLYANHDNLMTQINCRPIFVEFLWPLVRGARY